MNVPAARGHSVARIDDVARAAGVSRATVSRVINGRVTVDPLLAEKVRRAAGELNYQPSPVARSLSLGRTLAVGLVVPDLANPMFQAVLHSLSQAAEGDGYRVLVSDTAESPEREAAVIRDTRNRCDAVVLVAPRLSDSELSRLLPELDPVILLNRVAPGGEAPSVGVDYAAAAFAAVEHLVSLGHRRLVYLAGPRASASNWLRLAGLDRATAAFPDLDVDVIPCGQSMSHGFAVAEAVLASRATGVVAYNDLVAFGLLARLRGLNVGVPDELSVTGFDDIELAGYAIPALTTMNVPYEELGIRAWERLRSQTEGTAARVATEILPTRLVVRASTGPSPQAPFPGKE